MGFYIFLGIIAYFIIIPIYGIISNRKSYNEYAAQRRMRWQMFRRLK